MRFARVCREDGKEITYEDIIKGYKYMNGDYVILTDKDFESANVEKTHTIDIFHFVDESEVESIYYEKPFYLEPDSSAAKSYALLKEAIKKQKKQVLPGMLLRTGNILALLKYMRTF